MTTAVFSLVDRVLIQPLPYPDADRLVALYESSPAARERTSLIAPARLEDWNRLNRTFVALSGSYSENVTDTSGAEPERLEARRVAPRFFTVYGTLPLLGRTFTAQEEQPSGPGAAVISERFWIRRFHREAGVLQRALIIGAKPVQVVGVMPDSFTGAATDVWLPAQIAPGLMQVREARFLGGVARLQPGVALDEAARDLAAVQAALAREYPASDAGWSAEIHPLKTTRVGGAERGLMLVFGAVAMLWVVAVANVAGLTLVQVRRRTRELAIRASLGASRSRVIGTVIREGLLVAIVGGLLGGGFAAWLVGLLPSVLPRTPRINEVALDWRALIFTASTTLFAVVGFSLIPALAGTRNQLAGVIAAGSRTVTVGRHRLQKLLVVSQVAASVLLVGSATLLLQSYYNLTRVDTGFDTNNVVAFHVGARWDEDRTRVGLLQEQLLARLGELPHVQAAGMTNFLPTTSASLRFQVSIDGLSGPNPDGTMNVGARMISSGYLRAIGAPLVAGEWCRDATTRPRAPLTAMVNRRFVEVYASNQNLVGRTLLQGKTSFTIAGVVGNLAEDSHTAEPVPYAYTCSPPGWWPDPEYVVRTMDARALAGDVRRIVRELDSSRAIFGYRPLQAVMDGALERPRLDAAMLTVFAAAAVTLAALGLYALFTLVVSERSTEMAVRLAVGAAPSQVVALVMAGAGRLLGEGVVLGIALTFAADRMLRGVLFGVSPLDVRSLAASALTLAVVCAIAAAGPALRAARVPPVDALRGE